MNKFQWLVIIAVLSFLGGTAIWMMIRSADRASLSYQGPLSNVVVMEQNSKYEMILWGGPVIYSYYTDNYVINGNFIVIDRYVEHGPYVDSSIIRENRLMLPSGSTVIKSRK